ATSIRMSRLGNDPFCGADSPFAQGFPSLMLHLTTKSVADAVPRESADGGKSGRGGASGRGREELAPLRLRPLHPAHEPRRAVRGARRETQRPPHLARSAVALDVVAAQAARHEVLPAVGSPSRTRDHVVD